MEKRCSFELFKSNVCHWLKEEGDIDFLIQVLESDLILKYYNRKWYLESFYLLGMFDYICRINDVPICSEYDDLRRQRMQEIIYPAGVLLTARVLGDESIKEQALKEAIPENKIYQMLTSGTASLILPGCSWTAIQALAARWLPPLICDQLTLPKAAPLDSPTS